MSTPLYRNPNATIEDRVESLLAEMTLDEKIAQLGCLWSTALIGKGGFDAELAAEKMQHGIGQITRIGASTGLRPQESAALMNAIQKVAIERTRLGIPVIVHEETVGGFCHRDATVFPQGLGLAATWNPTLLKEVAQVIRTQMLAVGARHGLAPVLDVARDPRWGRVEETYGEDPVLSGTLGVAYVQGLQSDDLSRGVAATGKHFLAYANPIGGRNCAPINVGPRELREVYAEPFSAVIRDAGLVTIMNSYSSVDGLPCAGSPAILTDLLRGELGFSGAVVADYFAVSLLKTHHFVAADDADAARQALLAGMDMELPSLDCFPALKTEVEAGRVPLEAIDMAARRVLRLKFQLGLFEQPYVDAESASAVFQTPEQRKLARQAATESTILLKNDGILPLSPSVKRVAVIGPGADDQRLLQGDYHYPAHLEIIYLAPQSRSDITEFLPESGGAFAPGPYFTPHITPLAGLRAALPQDVEISYAKGCEVLGDDRSGFAEAVQIANASDVAVVVVAGKSGLFRPVTVGEGNDATDLALTGVQHALVDAIADTGKPLVVVVLSGRVHTLARVAERANALLQLFPAGEEGGNGLADVLTGKVSPSGRLPVSLPLSLGQVPNYLGMRAGGDRTFFFGDYSDSPTAPLFPFGHGLSYTSFSYRDLAVQATDTTQSVSISITVSNTGECSGDEVVQLYYRDEVASVARPIRMLLGFTRVSLAPGQSRRITFTVHPSRLAFYDAHMRFVSEPGAFSFYVGASSQDIRAEQKVTLDGGVSEYHQREIVATQVRIE
jgi:beta-glucosidase